ncbi:MAG: hypothetical protein R3D02_13970 [Hyphomicrobiales bacterium]
MATISSTAAPAPPLYLEIGTRADRARPLSDDDLYAEKDASGFHFLHKDKTPYA